ncbi:DUF2516 family protein [Jonesia denitrificans]|uniref:DUF2516 family protein n=1 Tax=Jonesia denitrificans (strain ATCC 14870 / DSM 20603 / BCRC 15368 / CIP 55.134 / JCM 11481 / NBRC 15587 / NCTC 10816 / Prevot 55134) TaxID=471856 RepID=C7R052_JONDD|nr:DUF2516 family protein [Jonesia denitrificans]ACV08111.1 hypothetical protein Jden_0446 [Jonesia denitrificans DSM 20603]AVJ53301.1 DUF2516 domain-containing protein [Jonesia denitrificans]QXB42810.1 DUF2516 family protein [Jonesia denitrificans]SQH20092.1 Protein of uncharacterised function (DUF2516) [Jonesia denitrificans]
MFAQLQAAILFVITTTCFALEVWAFVDALRRPPRAFTSEGKRTKKFWSILLGASALIGFLGLQPPLGAGYLNLSALFIAVPAFIYLADVRPALKPYGTTGGNQNNPRSW